ncbi:MAG: sulfate ABC transporter permease subunit CysW [Synechococcaceae cyanobacterium SM2_3_1]|nr:sulfate ABC transporter permease subunit CysW [Synechococcaceae cyanobacterium SM2_3_1]
MPVNRNSHPWPQVLCIGFTCLFLGLVLVLPLVNIFVQAFSKGATPFLHNLTQPDFISALNLTLISAAIAVPANTIFGLCAAWVIARHQFPGRTLLISVLDLPFSVSPVIAGLMFVLLFGRNGWLGPFLQAHNLRIIFAFPGILLATMFITLPFVAREVIPVLEATGQDEEEAARTLGASGWQTFCRITLPNIRLGLLYGVILTNARAMGEFGAVVVVSGNIAGRTQTLPLFVEDAYKQYRTEASYSAAVLLTCLAVFTLIAKELLEKRTSRSSGDSADKTGQIFP